MKRSAALGAALLALGIPEVAGAQAGASSQPGTPAPALVRMAPLGSTTYKEVAARLSRDSGVLVVADRTLANRAVTFDIPAGTLEAALARLAATLPKGAVIKKAFLPAPPPGAPAPDGDRVAALILAQEALYPPSGGGAAAGSGGTAGPSGTSGTVEILGKRLGPDKAAPVVAALDLKPVYLLTILADANDPVQKMSAAQVEALKTWMAMTPDQQSAMADQQFDMLMNMDPALRQQIFSQQRQMMGRFFQKLQGLPADQRQQFFRDLTGGAWDGTGMPPRPGAPGAGPGQP